MKSARALTLLSLLVAALFAFGCDGCSDDTSGNLNSTDVDAGNNVTSNNANEGCNDADNDGFSAGLTCDGVVDCNDSDPEINPNASEVCFDELDNNCDNAVDEGCGDCVEGETRTCGEEFGACVVGTQTCRDGAWSGCEGAVLPSPEQCNGIDDDCDGEIDENGDSLCDDNKVCNGVETCSMGACQPGEAVDCSMLNGPCLTGDCSEKDGGCRAYPVEDGTTCDDGLFCTVAGQCLAGECQTEARDCSGSTDQCNTGVCDESTDSCVAQPVSDGTTCDDGAFCTVMDSCSAGTCGGTMRDCSSAGDQCNSGVCNETSDACEPSPVSDGTSCDDNLFCNVGEACLAGVCTGGTTRQCGASGGSCRDGVCDEATDSCTGSPVPDGTTCDDGQFCTTADACLAGNCVGGGARDCSSAGDQCNNGVCNETTNQCVASPRPTGTTCDDSRFCTTNDRCVAGICNGSPLDCSAAGDACNTGVCDEAGDKCSSIPKSDGTACPDGNFCTVGDTCVSGACQSNARDCSGAGDQCNTGVCDDNVDRCVPQPVANGQPCNDTLYCTNGDSCQAGTCVSGLPRDCSGATMGDICLVGTCDESVDNCRAIPDPMPGPTCCDSSVDADLDGSNACNDCDDSNGGVFPGATERCNGVDDDCDGAIDEDFDVDMDGYSVCSTDPNVFDCDDNNGMVNPGMMEQCGPSGNGNGIDDDCDGYTDEGCGNCSTADADGDGVTECQGDCDDSDGTRYPGAPEVCDGKDNDCNTYTRANCGVSQPCNFDGDNNPENESDICQEDQICACEVNNSGSCTGNYLCVSFCNSSATGTPNDTSDGCTANQTCRYDLLRSANVHGCSATTDPPGTKSGGETCGSDSECRSLDCGKICVGPGCNQNYCQDWCGSDAYCPSSSTVCRLRRLSTNIDGRCWPSSNSLVGTTITGGSCTSDFTCRNGFCMTDPDSGSRYCSEACCKDSDCPSGFGCRLDGDAIDTNFVVPNTPPQTCTTDAQCSGQGGICFNGECAYRLTETSPMCVRDESGQGNRVAGQACSSNTQCRSNFCEDTLGVCVEVCCDDSSCPTGLTCEFQRVQTTTDRVTSARVCTNLSSEAIYTKM